MTYVYAIECGDFIKIGVATNTERRLASVQTASPVPVRMVRRLPSARDNAFYIERQVHRELAAQRASGEWFRRGPLDPVETLVRHHGYMRSSMYLYGVYEMLTHRVAAARRAKAEAKPRKRRMPKRWYAQAASPAFGNRSRRG